MSTIPNVISHSVVILVKGQLFATMGLWSNGSRHFVGTCDPRCNPSIHEREFTHLADAEQSFKDNVQISVDRGWTVAYRGPARVG